MKGIKFNQDGITAILEGRKTMTRRPLNDEQIFQRVHHVSENDCAKYKIGETVFVQEEFDEVEGRIFYATDVDGYNFSRNKKHASEMQEHQARIFLKITNIKVERLQNISFEDRYKEGCPLPYDMSAYEDESLKWFENDIWNKLPYQPPYDWNSDPYVFVYEFEIVK